VEGYGVTLSVTFVITGNAGVDTGPVALNILNNQRVIVNDDALSDVLMNLLALRSNRPTTKDVKNSDSKFQNSKKTTRKSKLTYFFFDRFITS